MPTHTTLQERLADGSPSDFSDRRALFINRTRKSSPEPSHTMGLGDLAKGILERNGVRVDVIRAVDHDIATGVYTDMTEHAGSATSGRRSSSR